MSHSRAEKEKESVGSRGVKEKARGGGEKESSEDRSEKGDAGAAKRASPAAGLGAGQEAGGGGWPAPSSEYLVLLGDAPLFALPLEALPFLQSDAFGSVSRDLSLQLFLKRFKLEEKAAGARLSLTGYFASSALCEACKLGVM